MSCEGPFPYLVTSCVYPRTHQRHQINLQTPTGNIQPFLSFRIEQGSLPFIHLAKRRSVSYGVGIGCVLARIVFFKAVAVPVTLISRWAKTALWQMGCQLSSRRTGASRFHWTRIFMEHLHHTWHQQSFAKGSTQRAEWLVFCLM